MKAIALPLAIGATALTLTLALLPARAAEAEKAPVQAVVHYADLDLGTDAGALALYDRIAGAARDVCPDYYQSRDLRYRQGVRSCREDAIARAIRTIGSPRLAAIGAARAGRTQPG